ncbi:sarcosine dehydrogenase, mitochondrial [Phlebotomus argentipes]|uniref:sarcosine dehydrogenase, mitochondrial n=1 Tax=Phlebotomus argentipes TaxID=94469 RepID=UPI002892AEE9|nr:sarcosine dehydrogenase, mitochondrial [Phlebotomus argentipes]
MIRFRGYSLAKKFSLSAVSQRFSSTSTSYERKNHILPYSADVVIIGGGSAGCHALYHLTKRGIKAVLVERSKITSGTTWHTAGLVWRLRPNDVEIQLLASSRNLLLSLESESGLDPGFIMNGGIFIAHSDVRMDEYRRLATIGKCFDVESHILDPHETKKLFPLLDEKAFTGALYSPGDGVVDPAMLCTALTRQAVKNGGQVFEECPVLDLEVGQGFLGPQDIRGVVTPYGTIKTNTVINATGVWGRDVIEKYGVNLPLVPMRHAYIVSEPMDGVKGRPNIRDHDFSVYFRIQGESICLGGYENCPILLDKVPADFQFGLYDLDWTVFESNYQGAALLCPPFESAGVKSTICGPESFTPDHKPLMGWDPRLDGLFHTCGYNSAGMMLGGGCGEQVAEWIINGSPSLHMFPYSITRFLPKQTRDHNWARERSHESYAKNYSIVFPYDQPMAGRNFLQDPFHRQMIQYFAVMEEKQGWERPGYFLTDSSAKVPLYDWYGNYGHSKALDSSYEEQLKKDYHFGFSENHDLIEEEATACRNNVVVFNLSYFCKIYLTGRDADKAAEYLFTGDTAKPINKTIYTCALNDRGGVEADVTVSIIDSGIGEPHAPILKRPGYYIVAGGASAYHSVSHLKMAILDKAFRAQITDVTRDLGVLSLQGRNSRDILEKLTDYDLSNDNLPPNSTAIVKLKLPSGAQNVRVVRVSFVGELGYELHIPQAICEQVFNAVMDAGAPLGLRNAGYRSLYSLSSEKGYHLWGFDLRSDDSPIEANLGFTCRKTGNYKGKAAIDKQRAEGIQKKLAFFTLEEKIPVYGLEAIYRDGEVVGHLRRGEYGYTLGKPIGQGYVRKPSGEKMDDEFLKTGNYEIDIMGRRHKATCHLRSPFDKKNARIQGIYK